MPGALIQRWTIGKGGFIGEVSLFELAEADMYVKGRSKRTYVELSNLYVHPLRRGRGWARELLKVAIAHARQNNHVVFLRAVPYGTAPHTLGDLLALYARYGFKHRAGADDLRELVLLK